MRQLRLDDLLSVKTVETTSGPPAADVGAEDGVVWIEGESGVEVVLEGAGVARRGEAAGASRGVERARLRALGQEVLGVLFPGSERLRVEAGVCMPLGNGLVLVRAVRVARLLLRKRRAGLCGSDGVGLGVGGSERSADDQELRRLVTRAVVDTMIYVCRQSQMSTSFGETVCLSHATHGASMWKLLRTDPRCCVRSSVGGRPRLRCGIVCCERGLRIVRRTVATMLHSRAAATHAEPLPISPPGRRLLQGARERAYVGGGVAGGEDQVQRHSVGAGVEDARRFREVR